MFSRYIRFRFKSRDGVKKAASVMNFNDMGDMFQ